MNKLVVNKLVSDTARTHKYVFYSELPDDDETEEDAITSMPLSDSLRTLRVPPFVRRAAAYGATTVTQALASRSS